MDEKSAHSSHGGSLKWATAKHALRCLIGCNIGEGTGAGLGLRVWMGYDSNNSGGCHVSIHYRISFYYDTNVKDNATETSSKSDRYR